MIQLNWTDYPEKADDEKYLNQLSLNPDFDFENNFSCHCLIEGDNYPVLQLLLKKGFCQKINLIYIDPPYNTGKDFTYSDNFSNAKDKHSQWLSFMKRRLECAQKLLCESGCIFIAIDQSELYYLKILCDQIFGEENFVNDFMWLHGKGKKDTWSRTLQQHNLCYAKNKSKLKSFTEIQSTSWAKKNIDNDPRGNWFSGSISFSEKRSNPNHKNYFEIKSPSGKIWKRQWQVTSEEMEKLISENKIYWGPAPDFSKVPRVKIFNESTSEVIPKNIIDEVESTRSAQRHLDELLGEKNVFDNPKPVDLIEHLIKITQMPSDSLIMDFFAGSGTTFEAVCNLNKEDNGKRKCILVQKPEKIKNPASEQTKTGFNFISDITKARCKKVSELYNTKVHFFKLS